MENLTPIQKFYLGKSIFITGATGFIGKVLLEKVLRCCPGVHQVYLLVREKRGKTAKQRVDQLFSYELFDLLKKEQPDFFNKISIVYGDLYSPSLGISSEDIEKLKENVNIVFHAAGRVKWDDELRLHTQAHVIASGILIDMVKTFKQVEAFVYVSSAGVHKEADFTVPEHVAKKHIRPNQLIAALKWMDDDTIKAIIPSLKKDALTYMLIKALTENIIEDNHGHLPTAIVRPGPVLPTYKDPFPGWCDTMQSPQGLSIAIAKGFMRVMYSKTDIKLWCSPADLTANVIITTAWHIGTSKSVNEVFVLNNILEGDKSPTLDKKYYDFYLAKMKKYQLANIYRYPSLTIHRSFFWYKIHSFFDQYLPAALIDILMYLSTGKTKMVSLYKKTDFMHEMFVKLSSDPYNFKMDNNHMLCSLLSKEDSEIFFMDLPDLDWDSYIDNSFLFCRKFLAKENYSNLGYAKKKAKIWLLVTSGLKWFIIFYFIYCIGSNFQK